MSTSGLTSKPSSSVCVQVCEKEKLLTERNQLKACMGELWENFSCLSQEVCRDVQLSPEQVQSLHHYCPVLRPGHEAKPANATTNNNSAGAAGAITNNTTSIDLTGRSASATPEPSFHGSPGGPPSESEPDSSVGNGPVDGDMEGRNAGPFAKSGLSPNQAVTVDFCQEMTDKCTTDEPPRTD